MNANINNIYPSPTPGATDQRLSITTTPLQLAAPLKATKYFVLDVQGGDLYVTFDGSTPTTSNGHLIADGTHLTWSVAAALSAQFLAAAGTVALHASEFTD